MTLLELCIKEGLDGDFIAQDENGKVWSDYQEPKYSNYSGKWFMASGKFLGKYNVTSDFYKVIVTREMLEKAKMPKFKVGDIVIPYAYETPWEIVAIKDNDTAICYSKGNAIVCSASLLKPYIDKRAVAREKIKEIIRNNLSTVIAVDEILEALESGKIDYDKK